MHYLYVKTHNVTGLKYLGKTKQNPYTYTGSGVRWKLHLEKHGVDISTVILLATEDTEELRSTGLFFSRIFDVVRSSDWANLTEESGSGGNTWDKRGRYISEATKIKMSAAQKGKTITEQHRLNMLGQKRSEEFKQNLSNLKRGIPRPRVDCPKCGTSIDVGNYKRWHEPRCLT